MLVELSNFDKTLDSLFIAPVLAVDVETTGFNAYGEDRLFSLVIADQFDAYYFNFNTGPNIEDRFILNDTHKQKLRAIFEDPYKTFYMHNAKFDWAFLEREGFTILGKVHCTLAVARILENHHLSYTLDACVKRIGLEKSSAVEDYIKKNRLWEWVSIPGKKTRTKRKFFGRVPLNTISAYAITDGKVTFALGQFQGANLRPQERQVFDNEVEFTKVAYGIEKTGIKIDKAYCLKAAEFERQRCREYAESFERHTALPFSDSPKVLGNAFRGVLKTLLKTEKGATSFNDDSLQTLKNDQTHWPIADLVLKHRDAYKKLNSYYQNFLYFADSEDVVHPNIRQSGTATGRVSIVDPALQTVNKEEDKQAEFSVRRSFIPRDGFFFVEMDYKAMEFRMLLDYAGEEKLASKIKQGLDPHQATADLVKIDRRSAKTISFGLLYGMGIKKLAHSLNISEDKARDLRQKYFSALPRVEAFIRNVTSTTKQRGFVFNWLGRRSYFPDTTFAYKAVNYLIQGGGADIVKKAMNEMGRFLNTKQSRMVLQIHDAVLFEISFNELDVIPTLKSIMENAYAPRKCLPMEVSVEYSLHSWGDLTHYGEESRDLIQREGLKRSQNLSPNLGSEGTASSDTRNTGYISVCQGLLCGA